MSPLPPRLLTLTAPPGTARRPQTAAATERQAVAAAPC
jgi:hypothetical protein